MKVKRSEVDSYSWIPSISIPS